MYTSQPNVDGLFLHATVALVIKCLYVYSQIKSSFYVPVIWLEKSK